MKTNHSQNNISKEWQVKTLGDFLEKLEGGGTPSKENPSYWSGSIPWASVKDVVTHNPNDTQDHISEIGLENSSSRLVSKGTLIVPTRMALGHAVVFDVDVAINQDLKALYPKKVLLNQYLFHWFKSKKDFIERLGSGSTVSGIQQNELKRIKFSLPPLPEQSRIVSVLETWDQLIKKLTQKIEIKKQIKKGLMQDLLTGKRRLAGFGEEWKPIKLGEIATFKKGKGLPKSDLDISGKYEAIHYGELFTKYNEFIENVISKTNTNKGMFLSKRNDILMPTSDVTPRGLSTASYLDKDGVILGGDILVIRSKGSLNGLFFSYLVNLNKKAVIKLVSGSTVFHLYGSDMAKFELKLPPMKEQESIVKILVTADKEITELQKKLLFFKEQKRYLLNNLITGTIRTPETLSAKITA